MEKVQILSRESLKKECWDFPILSSQFYLSSHFMVLQIDKDNISENYLKSESKFNIKTMKGLYLGLGDRQECLK